MLKAVRHFDRSHWEWSIVINNCNSHPSLVASALQWGSGARDHQLQNKSKSVTYESFAVFEATQYLI